MAHARVDHLGPAGGRAVAQAVAVGAQVRAALDDLASHAELWLPGVVARLEVATARVARGAAGGAGALILLIRKVSVDKVIPQIKVPGKIIQTSLDNESEQRLADALAAAGQN